jgi:hypothetical protein
MKDIKYNIDITKPYRIDRYTDIDAIYAKEVYSLYKNIPPRISTSFDKFTDNLMYDEAISRNELLKAIDSYELYDTGYITYTSNEWSIFTEKVYRCNNTNICRIL